MPYISVNHSLKIDCSAQSFSEPFAENSFYDSKHASAIELLKLLIRYNDPVDYKGENGQQ